MNSKMIAQGHEWAWKAEEAASTSMALIYWGKAENYYRDGGDNERANEAADRRARIG